MPEPKVEWGKELVNKVDEVDDRVKGLAGRVEEVSNVVVRIRDDWTSISEFRGATAKKLDDIDNRLGSLSELGTISKWLKGGLLGIGGAVIGAVWWASSVDTSVKNQEKNIARIENSVEELQRIVATSSGRFDATAKSIEEAAKSMEQSAVASKNAATEMRSQLALLSKLNRPYQEQTLRFRLAGMKPTENGGSLDFLFKLPRPIPEDEVADAVLSARLIMPSIREVPVVQVLASLSEDGKACTVSVFAIENKYALITEKIPISAEVTIKTLPKKPK